VLTYGSLLTHAQSFMVAAAGAAREGRYREAFALREQSHAYLSAATRMRKRSSTSAANGSKP